MRTTRGYNLCTMWSTWGIHKSCVFECLPAVQVWALARIPLNPYIFPTQSLANGSFILEGLSGIERSSICMDFIVHMEMWNNKVFSNMDIDSRDTLKLAKTSHLFGLRHKFFTYPGNQSKLITSRSNSTVYPREMLFYGWIMEKISNLFGTRVV